MSDRKNKIRGIQFMMLAALFFAMNAAIVKHLAPTLPYSVLKKLDRKI